MNSLNLKTYLLYAIYIVRTHPSILIFLGALGLLSETTVYLPEGGVVQLINLLSILAPMIISPVIYGMYYEIIEDKYSSIINIFKTYVGGYILVLLCMSVPIVFTMLLFISASSGVPNTGFVIVTFLFFSLLFIYVVPTYYISGKILESIGIGMRFFSNNFLSSAPLLLMTLFSELILLLSHFLLGDLKENTPALFVGIDFSLYMIASITDLILFIMLIYVLKNEDIKKR